MKRPLWSALVLTALWAVYGIATTCVFYQTVYGIVTNYVFYQTMEPSKRELVAIIGFALMLVVGTTLLFIPKRHGGVFADE